MAEVAPALYSLRVKGTQYLVNNVIRTWSGSYWKCLHNRGSSCALCKSERNRVESEEQKVESEEQKVESEEQKVESEEQKVESEEQNPTLIKKGKKDLWLYPMIRMMADSRGWTLLIPTADRVGPIKVTERIKYNCPCGTLCETSLHHFREGKTSCKNCAQKRRDSTMTKKYGHANAAHCPELKAKKEATCVKNHGTISPFGNEDVRAKAHTMMIERHGATTTLGSKVLYEKVRTTIKEQYGHEYVMQIPEFKAAAEQTNLRVRGVTNSLKDPAVQAKKAETLFRNWGVRNPMHATEILEKCQSSAYQRKEHTFSNGRTVSYQGFELFAINLLLRQGVTEDEIADGYDRLRTTVVIKYRMDGDGEHRYYPDLFLPKSNRMIEVKSEWTALRDPMKNAAKVTAVQNAGYLCSMWIMGRKGELLKELSVEEVRDIARNDKPKDVNETKV